MIRHILLTNFRLELKFLFSQSNSVYGALNTLRLCIMRYINLRLTWRRVWASGGKLVSGDREEAPCTDVLGMRLLHAGHDVNSRLRWHRLWDAHWSFLHGLLHPRRSCKLPSNRHIITTIISSRLYSVTMHYVIKHRFADLLTICNMRDRLYN